MGGQSSGLCWDRESLEPLLPALLVHVSDA